MVLRRCRTLYNTALEQRKTAWERHHVSLTYYQQAGEFPDLKRACSEFVEVHARVLQDVLVRLDRAFQAFFRRLKAGEHPGYPCYQGVTVTTASPTPSTARARCWMAACSASPRLAAFPSGCTVPCTAPPKTVTISREPDGWYACFSSAGVPVQMFPRTGCDTGIDVGLKVLLVTADGTIVENPRHYRKAEQRLTKAQRRVSRRQKGSNRHMKAIAQVTCSPSLKGRGFSVPPRRHPHESPKALPAPLDVLGRVQIAVQDQAAVRTDVGTHRQALVDALPTA
jgi:putative transposase